MERKKASDYPQELLDLFHEYQHGDINRRDFLDRAKKFAVGGLTAAAIFETLRPNYAWAEQVPKDDPRIKVSYETVASPEGNGSIKGYFARPASAAGKLPAVLVIHENRGLNPYVEDVARRFAVANFIAYAPDGLTSVGGFPGNDEEGAVKFRSVNGPKMIEDFVASAKWLKARPGMQRQARRHRVLLRRRHRQPARRAARQRSRRRRAVLRPPAERRGRGEDHGAADAAVRRRDHRHRRRQPASRRSRPRSRRTTRRTRSSIYKGAQHGFHNDTTPRYDESVGQARVGADARVLQQEPALILRSRLSRRHEAHKGLWIQRALRVASWRS